MVGPLLSRLLLLCAGCQPQGEPLPPSMSAGDRAQEVPSGALPTAGPKGPLVLLVSWDTTRADALGCYEAEAHWGLDLEPEQRPSPRTPTADALAARGVRARWALAHAPTTLNSHASVFSGLDPHGHRVPRNGFPVPPDVPLLGERFADAGWDTIAVVGASVLEQDMGISRGFRVYDDDVGTRVRRRHEDPADRVVDRVLAALDARTSTTDPLFLFAHFFDAHSPWDTAPETVREALFDPEYRGPFDGSGPAMDWLIRSTRQGRVSTGDRRQARAAYLAEVSFADQELGRLLRGLDERGYGGEQLVVLFGDHGEALDERPGRPYQHGLDVDLPVIHVPLILSGQGRFALPAGRVFDQPASLSDVGPTILGLAGLDGGIGDGEDLRQRWEAPLEADRQDTPHFAEATKPGALEGSTGWNNLGFSRAVVHAGRMLRHAPALAEPASLHALAPGQPVVPDDGQAMALRALLDGWDAGAPSRRTVSLRPETRSALEALGYLEPGNEPGNE